MSAIDVVKGLEDPAGVLRLYIALRSFIAPARTFEEYVTSGDWKATMRVVHTESLRLRGGKFPGYKTIKNQQKIVVLALYVDYIEHPDQKGKAPVSLADFLTCAFKKEEAEQDTTTAAPEPVDTEIRYQQLLEPLEAEHVEELVEVAEEPTPKTTQLISVPVSRVILEQCIEIMKSLDKTELPPPGASVLDIVSGAQAGFEAKLVMSESGPFIDAYLEIDDEVVAEGVPIRDTAFLEGCSPINIQHKGCAYEFRVDPVD